MANSTKGSMDFLLVLGRQVIDELNTKFACDFTAKEISVALKQMHLTKAFELDGMPSIFFQKHWNLVGPPVTKSLLQALNSSQLPHDLNHTHITLIPKKNVKLKL